MMGREPILTLDGQPITDRKNRRSYATSAGSAPSLGKHVLMSYLPPEHAVEGTQPAGRVPGRAVPRHGRPRRQRSPVRRRQRSDHGLMEILVCIKRVPAVGSALVLTDDSMDVDTRRLGFQLSPHEENAVEAAVQLIEQHGGSVTLLSMGTAESEEQLREQLAIGADRAIIAVTDGTEPDPQATVAASSSRPSAPTARRSISSCSVRSRPTSGGYQTGIRLAHALGLPVVTNVKGLVIDDGKARCERAVGTEREVYEVSLPAVLTVKDGLNIPRYPSVPGRIKARKKPVTTHEVAARRAAHRQAPPGRAAGNRQGHESSGAECRGCRSARRGVPRDRSPVVILVHVDMTGVWPTRSLSQALTLARSLDSDVQAVVAGDAPAAATAAAYGASVVHVAEHAGLSDYAPRAIAKSIVQLIETLSPACVLAGGTRPWQRGDGTRRRVPRCPLGDGLRRDHHRLALRGHSRPVGRQPARGVLRHRTDAAAQLSLRTP